VLEKVKSAYQAWIVAHHDMPRTERFGIGSKIDFLFLDLMELIRKASYTSTVAKVELLDQALTKTDSLAFFIQLAWDSRLLSNPQFGFLGSEVNEIGKIINGWKMGIVAKTQPSLEKSWERK